MIKNNVVPQLKYLSLLVFLMITISPTVAQTAESFFEFTEVVDSAHTFGQRDQALSILRGLSLDQGWYQIEGQQFSQMDVAGARSLPSPPLGQPAAAAALIGEEVFLVGDQNLLVMDTGDASAAWTHCAALPEDSGSDVVLAQQQGTLYLAGVGMDGLSTYAYDRRQGVWVARADAPQDMRGYVATACGHDHILYFDGAKASDTILAYHRVTDTWFPMGQLPRALQVAAVGSEGTQFTLYAADVVLQGEALLRPTKYGWYDHAVLACLVALLVGVGLYFSKKEKSSGDYFRGGQRIPWWAAGLSLFATGASAISLMAMPGKAFSENWIYFSGAIFLVMIQLPLLLLVYIPVARRLNISTANEYLERRFSLPVRMLGFVCFSLNQMLGRMAAILLLPALAISAIFGLPMEYSILIMGVVTTLFVTMGGLEAVIWTDVLQAVIMLLAVALCAMYACTHLDLSWPVAMDLLENLDKLQMFDWRIDWQAPVVIVMALNTFVTVLGLIGDQNFIQRVQCTQDEKESRKAVYTQLAVAVPMNFVLFALGTLLFLFYVTRADTISPALKADGVFPFFAAQNLPAGLAGFVVVALLAATISTVSSAMNSVANLGVEDVYRRFYPDVSDQQCLVFGRRLTLGLGLFGTIAALILANTSGLQSIWDLFLMITGVVLAPITGIFVLGIFSRRVNTFGVWMGTLCSVAANYYAKFHLDLHAMVYVIVGVFTCIVVAWCASFFAPAPPNDKVDGLTIFSIKKTEEDT